MFRIKLIAKGGLKNPHKRTFDYRGDSVDCYVKELVKEYIFKHGFQQVRITINLIGEPPFHIQQKLGTCIIQLNSKPSSFLQQVIGLQPQKDCSLLQSAIA